MPLSDTGCLIAIARRPERRAPMEELREGVVSIEAGLEGDHKGAKFKNRAITVLALEDWRTALAELRDLAGEVPLSWLARRANLLVEGVDLPKARGSVLRIGHVELEVTYPTQPCRRMDEAYQGLLKALHPDWRGGVTCRVLSGGTLRIGDVAEVTKRLPQQPRKRLP